MPDAGKRGRVVNSAVVNSAEGVGEGGERTLKEKGERGGERAREWRSLVAEDENGGNERRWSVVTANYTIVGRLTMESGPGLRASRRNEFFLRFESRGLF